jgi:cell division protein FtsB
VRSPSKKANPAIRKRIVLLGIGFVILAIFVTVLFGKKGYMDILQARKRYAALEEERVAMERRRAFLEWEIERLKTDPSAVEKAAREKLWMVRPDEIIVVFSRSAAPAPRERDSQESRKDE